jgi:hypothetical protein
LLGTWRVVYSGFKGVAAEGRWAFAADTLTIREGERGLKVSYQLLQKGPRAEFAFDLLGERWTGRYAVLDGEALALRLTRSGSAASGLVLLIREAPQATVGPPPLAK